MMIFYLSAGVATAVHKIGEATQGENGSEVGYLVGTDNFYDWWLHMSQYSFPSIAHLVTQDVLVLAGEEDPASSMKFYPRYIKARKNAKSVMGRVFTKEEHAASHNQIGNIKLALDFILDWIDEFSEE